MAETVTKDPRMELAAAQAAYLRTKSADRLGFLKPANALTVVDIPLAGAPRFNEGRFTREFGEWPATATRELLHDEDIEAAPAMRELDDDPDLAALKALHGTATSAFRDIVETIAQVRDDDDPSLNADGRLKLAVKVVKPKLDKLASQAERELVRVDSAIAETEAAVTKAFRNVDAVGLAAHAEIRAHAKGLDAAGRAKFVSQAISQGDTETLQALVTGKDYLSGIGETDRARMTATLQSLIAPAETKRLQALRVGKARALQALSALDRGANQFLDFKKARELLEREACRSIG